MLGTVKSDESNGPQETDTVMEKPLQVHPPPPPTQPGQRPPMTLPLTSLTPPLPPAPFLCAPPLL